MNIDFSLLIIYSYGRNILLGGVIVRRKSITLLLLALLILGTGCSGSQDDESLTMGFVPLVDGDKLIESVEPLSEMLTEEMGVNVEAFTATNYVGVVEGLGSGQIDFGIIPPFAYVLANKESDAEVILTSVDDDGSIGYHSEILVRKDSGIDSIEDLRGKTVAFVDPSSTSGYLFPGAYLIENGIDLEEDIDYTYSGGHDKSLQLLLNGDVDAIATFSSIGIRYREEFPTAEEELKSIGQTELIPGISVTVSSSMDEETKEKLTKTLENLGENKEAKALMTDLFNIEGFQRATAEDYEVIKKTAKTMNVELE